MNIMNTIILILLKYGLYYLRTTANLADSSVMTMKQRGGRSLKKKVISMHAAKKNIKDSDILVYDTELIFTIVMDLQQSPNLNIKDLLIYELSPVLPALFDDHESMLDKKLQENASSRQTGPSYAVFNDGCALILDSTLTGGCVVDYLESFTSSISYQLRSSEVYLIFDRLCKQC